MAAPSRPSLLMPDGGQLSTHTVLHYSWGLAGNLKL
jgi:hypothetical protein